nr:PepSY domain-containing protein [Candidatus Woesearchaeota archaeon]
MSKTIEKIIFGVLIVAIIGVTTQIIAGMNNEKPQEIQVSNDDQQISLEQAKTIALNAVDMNKVGKLTDAEIENENGDVIYSIEFTKDNIETDVKIDAKNGNILVIENDLTETDQDDNEEKDDDENEEELSDEALAQIEGKITEEQAIEIAKTQVDMSIVGKITDVELEKENGIVVYAVEFTKNNIETDVKIDAKIGKVIEIESDLDEEEED